MKKRGFTLIELLAVIVVLAIIALIATPIVMNTIKSAKKGAAERSADSYIGAVETAVATAKLDGKDIPDGTYKIDAEGNLTGEGLPDSKLTIDMKGNKPTEGTITIKNDQVTNDSEMTIGDYDVAYNEDNKKYEATEKENDSSTIVYRWSENSINIGDTINPDDTTKYTKDSTTLGKEFYLKHLLDRDNKVVDSYVCLKYSGKESCLRGGSTDYYGWTTDSNNYTGNLLVLKQLQDDGASCTFSETESECIINSIHLIARSNGNDANATDYINGCGVYGKGISNCGSY